MIILENPYVSDVLINTITDNNFAVLDNEIARKYFSKDRLTSTDEAVKRLQNGELFYSNSENSTDWVLNNAPDSDLAMMIKLSKNKYDFRNAIKSIYPNYFFKELSLNELKSADINSLKFPLILKPEVGFLSFGVFAIQNKNEWQEVVSKIDTEIEKFKGIFPKSVVNTENFLIEELIDGEEFAVDAYFDNEGNATILNIFQHPFFDGKDVSDRAYFTSKAILEKHLKDFKTTLDKIGKVAGYKNFPFHLELRCNEKDIIPIELNPMRFCGWCITDIALNAWGINVYKSFINQEKPDWQSILANKKDEIYYFTIGDIPSNIDKSAIKNVNYEKYLKNISEPMVVRKIDYKNNPIFAIVFAKTTDFNEIKNILSLKMDKFVEL